LRDITCAAPQHLSHQLLVPCRQRAASCACASALEVRNLDKLVKLDLAVAVLVDFADHSIKLLLIWFEP
jgi:hypothetical protein